MKFYSSYNFTEKAGGSWCLLTGILFLLMIRQMRNNNLRSSIQLDNVSDMKDHFSTIFGCTFLGVILSGLIAPLFGYGGVLREEKICYQSKTYDHTAEYYGAAIGLLLGGYLLYKDIKKSKEEVK